MENLGLGGVLENDGLIQERFDIVISSPGWKLEFNCANVSNLETKASDHNALLINTKFNFRKKKRRFYFDKRLSEKEEVNRTIDRS